MYRLLCALFMTVGAAVSAHATEPHQESQQGFVWDAGVSFASLSFPAYRGSKVRETLALPLPSFSFSSEKLSLGRDGAKVDVYDARRVHFNLSAAGSLPVDSDDIPLRSGMPDLSPSIELGPALIIVLPCWRGWVCLQETLARGVIASDFEQVETIGWTLQPRLTFRRSAPKQARHKHDWDITLGPVYATRLYHDYFYTVEPRFATTERPAYQARSGFSGWRFSLTHVYQFGEFGIYSYVSYDNMRDTAFADSPLLETKDYVLGGIALRWTLWGSHIQR